MRKCAPRTSLNFSRPTASSCRLRFSKPSQILEELPRFQQRERGQVFAYAHVSKARCERFPLTAPLGAGHTCAPA